MFGGESDAEAALTDLRGGADLAHDERRHLAAGEHLRSGRTEPQPAERTMAMRAHQHQTVAAARGVLRDLLSRVSDHLQLAERDALLLQQPLGGAERLLGLLVVVALHDAASERR